MKLKSLLTLTLCALLLAACNLPAEIKAGSAGALTIVQPLDGQQFQVGDLVDVKSLANISFAADLAILFVNDTPYRSDALANPFSAGSIYLPWRPSAPGIYTLRVHLAGSGGEADSNSVTVSVGTQAIPTIDAPTLAAPETSPTFTTTVAVAPTLAVPETSPTFTTTVAVAPTQTLFIPSATVESSLTPFIPSATIEPSRTPTVVIVANSTLSGKVYRDENGNGSFNPADTPLPGVTVLLGTGVCPSSGLRTTIVDSSGNYAFTGLPAGQYCTTVDVNSLPPIGGTWSPSLPNPITVTLGENENLGGRNFMFQPVIQ